MSKKESIIKCFLYVTTIVTLYGYSQVESQLMAMEYTDKLLNELEKRNVKATFFLVGKKAYQYPELVKKISDSGHLIGNHTYTHIQLTRVSDDTAYIEINKTNDEIFKIAKKETLFIRPPFGSYKKEYFSCANMIVTLWDIDPKDWCTYDAQLVANRVINSAGDGKIILLHDIFDTSVEAAIKIIDTLKKQGYQFVTVDELILNWFVMYLVIQHY